MSKKYHLTLTLHERESLNDLIHQGKVSASKMLHARIMLKADESPCGPGWMDVRIAEALDCGVATIERLRQRFVEEGLEAALVKRPTSRTYERKIDGPVEAHLVAMVCADPPQGRARWTLRLLADKLMALGYVDHVAPETVRQTLKKTNLNPGWSKDGAWPENQTPTL